ncbi:hypothetical protein GCM10022225_17990 [Plantactinospora mayteni]|uniref:BioF2-like acetyltransferase domain-containing protein n=1 Tax=Plantactinospora mayteni TaxID=566021 RepID=A0ABQ4EI25_9ACTN|nr:GNAT family N-acetyltransferase [Plantactinospora mayteni]GIG93872.1 hypothetical protein Pma05_04450 [Plantactinospora mayteni]
MSTRLGILDPTGAADRLDPVCPDVYFTAGYGAAAATPEGGVWRTLHWRDTIMVPYVLRRIDDQLFDTVSPYGYAGVYRSADCPAEDLTRFWSLAVEYWRDTRVVSLFLRFSPLDPSSVDAALGLGAIGMTRRADTITVTVDGGPDRIWAGMSSTCRNKVRKARNAGLTGDIRPATSDDMAHGSAFRRLYEETMVRVGGAPEYFFPDAYYHRLAHGVGKNLLVAEVRTAEGAVVAASLVLRHGTRAHYHLAGSTPEGFRQGGNNLLLWTILDWASATGCGVVHLGGGVRPDDGLFQFKRSFGGRRTPFWTGAVVIDPARYDALLRAHAAATSRTVPDIVRSGYFPGYRLR